jgi:pyruvate/2-oxoglutarate dehydrogenase complex dihydrolipoamide acyltransferase (E2) component
MVRMAKKADKALKNLQKDVSKLRKQNDKLAKALEETREEQAEALREIRALLEERVTAQEAGPVDSSQEDHSPDGEVEEGREVTEAAERRAKELGVDPSGVKGTGSGGRVLVKDVESAAEGER